MSKEDKTSFDDFSDSQRLEEVLDSNLNVMNLRQTKMNQTLRRIESLFLSTSVDIKLQRNYIDECKLILLSTVVDITNEIDVVTNNLLISIDKQDEKIFKTEATLNSIRQNALVDSQISIIENNLVNSSFGWSETPNEVLESSKIIPELLVGSQESVNDFNS